jgi:hypothetical protein
MAFETKRVLITIKAYPNPSISYGETVCCAGLDLDSLSWMRLWPVPFRDLPYVQQFNKYDIIEVSCKKASADKRPESYKIDPTSIRILESISSKDLWKKREAFVLSVPLKTQCEIEKESLEFDTSLGLIKPCRITFSIKPRPRSSPEERRACYAQAGLFIPKKDPIEEIPYHFYFEFSCFGLPNCSGHKLPILDWEIGAAYRKFGTISESERVRLEKVRAKWLDLSNLSKRNVYFYTGNQLRFRDQFGILGVFYPPIRREEPRLWKDE